MNAVLVESTEFSFDEWVQLWQSDPEAAAARRRAEIQAVIDSAPEHKRERLIRLQWRIDQEIARHKTPLGATVALTRMMMDWYAGPGGLYDQITGPLQEVSVHLLEMNTLVCKLNTLTIHQTASAVLLAPPPESEEKP